MNEIFKAIDAIDWAELEHAYGSAADVPADLKTLFGSDEDACQKTIEAFWGNIYHQGTIYEATSYAVPFLIAAMDYCPKFTKSSLVVLLAHIANGMSYNIQHQSLWEEGGTFDTGRTKTDSYKEETERQLHWVERGILAVWDGWDTYLELLKDKVEYVRSEVGLLLVSLANSSYRPDYMTEDVSTLLFDKFQACLSIENTVSVKVGLLNGIANLKVPIEKKTAILKYYIGEPNPVLKITAAYYLVELVQDEAAIEVLNKALIDIDETNKLFSDSVWFQMNMSYYILALLSSLPVTYFDQLAEAFEQSIRSTYQFGAAYTTSPVVQMVFEGKPIDAIAPEFTPVQRRVLQVIAETDNLWIENDGNASIEFQNWGLTRDRTLLKKWLSN